MGKRSKIIFKEQSIALNLAWILCIAVLSLAIVVPLIFVFTLPRAEDFAYAFSSDSIKEAIVNTFTVCISSTALSVLIGYIYAYAIVKGNIPFAKFFATIPFIHLMTPPFVGGLSFILLLGRNGFITHTLLGLDVSLYGYWGLLIAQSLCFFPMAYMILSSTISSINPSYEQSSYSLGASRLKTFFTVTLPLSFPGILSALLFIAVSVMSDFGNPMIVAGRYRVLAVEIYTQLTGWVKPGHSAVLGIILVIPSTILFIIQNILTRKNMIKTATIGGKVTSKQETKPRLITTIILTAFCSFIALCVIIQFAAIVAGTFQKLWGIDTSFTFKHVENISKYSKEIFNSVRFALMGAAISTVIACVSSFLVYRTDCTLKKYIDIICQLASAVPGSLFGLAFSITATKLCIRNSPLMITIAIAVGFLPFSYRIMASSFAQIKPTLDDGARALGASRLKVLFSILVPLSTKSVGYAFLYDFVRGVGTMSAVIFLVSFKTPLASIKILNLAEEGFWGDAAALALLLTIVTFGILAVGSLIIKLWRKR